MTRLYAPDSSSKASLIFNTCQLHLPKKILLFTMVWRITRWTGVRQPLPFPKELRAHRDRSMGKAETSHTSHNPIPLFKGEATVQ